MLYATMIPIHAIVQVLTGADPNALGYPVLRLQVSKCPMGSRVSIERDYAKAGVFTMRHPASNTITFDEVDNILRDALDRAKEVCRKANGDTWIGRTRSIDGIPRIEGSPIAQNGCLKEMSKAAER